MQRKEALQGKRQEPIQAIQSCNSALAGWSDLDLGA
jgi:hypothetical protein